MTKGETKAMLNAFVKKYALKGKNAVSDQDCGSNVDTASESGTTAGDSYPIFNGQFKLLK